MPSPALTAAEVAAEFKCSKTWIYDNWRRLVAEKRLPPPIMETGHLVWSAAQVYAYLDKKIPKDLRPFVAAHRAAMNAAASAPADREATEDVEYWREKLDRRYEKQEA